VYHKSTTCPAETGQALLQKEEKVNVLIIKHFPSFPRRGVIRQLADDGVVKIPFDTASLKATS
jgi:hypothetical protein